MTWTFDAVGRAAGARLRLHGLRGLVHVSSAADLLQIVVTVTVGSSARCRSQVVAEQVVDVVSVEAGPGARSVDPRHHARVEVVVPAGTLVEVDGCAWVEIDDVAGPVSAVVSGRDVLRVHGAGAVRVVVSGQGEVRSVAGTGPVRVSATDLARVRIEGRIDETLVEASGQAEVDVRGDLRHVAGRAIGMSVISAAGQVHSHRLRTLGDAVAEVNGQAVTR